LHFHVHRTQNVTAKWYAILFEILQIPFKATLGPSFQANVGMQSYKRAMTASLNTLHNSCMGSFPGTAKALQSRKHLH
jgi:hypothetical protein